MTGWKLLVYTRLLKIFNDNKFSLNEVYKDIDFYKKKYPNNRHIKEKIRQTLQFLVKDSYINRIEEGLYQINVSLITQQEKELRHTLDSIYYVFIKTYVYMNIKSNTLRLDDFILFYQYFNMDYSRFRVSNKLDLLWSLFLSVNEKLINSKLSQERLFNELLKNKNIFKINAPFRIYNEHFNNLINRINIKNKDYCIIEILSESLKRKFKENNIYKISHIKFDKLSNMIFEKNEFEQLKYILSDFQTPIEMSIYDLFDKYYFKMDFRSRDVLFYRKKGLTLEQIGKKYKLTRERIRQIESKEVRKFRNNLYKKIKRKLIGYSNKLGFIKESKLKSIFKEHYPVFKYLKRTNFINDYQIYILDKNNKKILINKIEKLSKYIKNNYLYIRRSNYKQVKDDIINNFSLYIDKDLINQVIFNDYNINNNYMYNKNLTNIEEYLIVFKDGFKTLTYDNVKEFKNYHYKIFNNKDIFDRSDRAVLSRAIDNEDIILIDRGTYSLIPDRLKMIDREMLETIYNFIKAEEVVRMKYLYEKFSSNIQLYIKNLYELHSILKLTFSDLYFSKDNVGVEINPTLNIGEIIFDYAVKNNGLININRLMSNKKELQGTYIEQFLHKSNDYIAIYNKNYLHKDYIYVNDDELIKLEKEVLKHIYKYKYISQSQLLLLFKDLAPDITKVNKINNNTMAFNLFSAINNQTFIFTYPNITIAKYNDVLKDIKNADDVIINNLKDKNSIKIQHIRDEANKLNYNIVNMRKLLEKFYEVGFIRYNDVLIKLNAVMNDNFKNYFLRSFTEYINYQIMPMLNTVGYINITDDYAYEGLPKLSAKFSWNKHFFAHLLMHFGEGLKVKTQGNSYVNLNYEVRLNNYD